LKATSEAFWGIRKSTTSVRIGMHSNLAIWRSPLKSLLQIVVLICGCPFLSTIEAQETETAAAPGTVIAKMGEEVEKVQPFVAGE
jgi:hypothetical protein